MILSPAKHSSGLNKHSHIKKVPNQNQMLMNTLNCFMEQLWSMLTVENKCRSSQDGSWGGMLAGPPSPEKSRRLQTGMTRSNSQTVGNLDPVSVSKLHMLTRHCCAHNCPDRELTETCSASNMLDSFAAKVMPHAKAEICSLQTLLLSSAHKVLPVC